MASYGSNTEVQKLAFGSSDSNQDTRTTAARDLATSIINAKLGLVNDLNTPTNEITRIANMLAAGIILSGQITVDSQSMHPFYVEAMELLKDVDLSGISEITQTTGFIVDRF